jgi:hypothetical protein
LLRLPPLLFDLRLRVGRRAFQRTLQAGAAFGIMVEDTEEQVQKYLLVSSATLCEALCLAASRSPTNPQVISSLASPLKVFRPAS